MTLLKNKHQLLYRRRELRKRQTKHEDILWQLIRNRKLGVKFRRQYSMGSYILDFFCPEIKLVIEVDGVNHDLKDSIMYDKERTQYLEILGCQILRFKNKELEENSQEVLLKMKGFINPLLVKERVGWGEFFGLDELLHFLYKERVGWGKVR